MADARSPRGREQRGSNRPGERSGRQRAGRPTSPESFEQDALSQDTAQFLFTDSDEASAVERTNPRGIPAAQQSSTRPAADRAPRHGLLGGLIAGARRAAASPNAALLAAPGAQRMRTLLAAQSSNDRPRAKFTGRMAALVLVLAVLTVMFASSLRAYVQQRDHLNELRAGNAQLRQNNAQIESELERWKDPAYVKARAREDLGYMYPGETGFNVVGADGKPLAKTSALPEPASKPKKKAPWWDDAWASVELAGNPPQVKKPTDNPNTTINGTKPDVAEGTSTQ